MLERLLEIIRFIKRFIKSKEEDEFHPLLINRMEGIEPSPAT